MSKDRESMGHNFKMDDTTDSVITDREKLDDLRVAATLSDQLASLKSSMNDAAHEIAASQEGLSLWPLDDPDMRAKIKEVLESNRVQMAFLKDQLDIIIDNNLGIGAKTMTDEDLTGIRSSTGYPAWNMSKKDMTMPAAIPIAEAQVIRDLIKVANSLDAKGFAKEADRLDALITIAAGSDYHDGFGPDERIDFLDKGEYSSLFDDENLEQLTGNESNDEGDYYETLAEGVASPEERLLRLIHGSEEIASRLGLTHFEATMTSEELRENLQENLNLDGLTEEEVDTVMSLAVRLLEKPATTLAGTPRVTIKENNI